MKDRLTTVLDRSLRANGISLNRNELTAVAADLNIFVSTVLQEKEVVVQNGEAVEPPAVASPIG